MKTIWIRCSRISSEQIKRLEALGFKVMVVIK
jgi:predicted nuclease of predicted toxin-antitoxin system